MTPEDKINEIKQTLKHLKEKQKGGCKDCDNDELIYHLEQEIKRLKK